MKKMIEEVERKWPQKKKKKEDQRYLIKSWNHYFWTQIAWVSKIVTKGSDGTWIIWVTSAGFMDLVTWKVERILRNGNFSVGFYCPPLPLPHLPSLTWLKCSVGRILVTLWCAESISELRLHPPFTPAGTPLPLALPTNESPDHLPALLSPL